MTNVTAQRALEALRNGVPNADAVRALGCMQPEALDRFRRQLEQLAGKSTDGGPSFVPGMLIAGDFGAGKSHTLSFLEQEALARNFVVSRLVISKETPLHDPAKLFQAAVREARLPESRGSLLHELALRIDYRSNAAKSFVGWATRGQPFGMVAASVLIDERSHNAELKERIVNWWSGEKLEVAQVRAGLKEIDMPKAVEVKAVSIAALAPVRFEFAVRLARAVGVSGWVLLFDEIELVARYSLLQRARAYAELARWLGAVPEQGILGITAVAAISNDFDIDVLQRRNDHEKAPDRLKQKGDQRSLAQALMGKIGIELISEKAVPLHAPNDDTLVVAFDRLRRLYEIAYGYRPDGDPALEGGQHRAMRSYVRRWISEWDLDRLYGKREHTVIEEPIQVDYSEDPDLVCESEARAGEPE